MSAVWLVLVLTLSSNAQTHLAESARIAAFGCDTSAEEGTPLESYAPAFYSAASLRVLLSEKCRFAGPDADPLGPCFPSPAAVKRSLDALPAGRRAISLEGNSLYNVQNASHMSQFQDLLADGSPSPWVDSWARVVRSRFQAWFANFSSIGGQVDVILADWEQGGKLYWYSFASRSANGSHTAALLSKDPRWPPLRERLNAAARGLLGNETHVNFNNISDINEWNGFSAPPFKDWRPWIWDIVTVDSMLAESLNRSVFEPIRSFFPQVRFSNFAHHYHSDPSIGPGVWWPWAANSAISPLGKGSHVGTHQSTSFYGGRPFESYEGLLVSQSSDRIWQAAATPFNALVQETLIARDMVGQAPHVPVAPWFAPRDFVVSDPGKLPNATSHLHDSDMWQESLFHVILSTAATDVLWWKPGHMRPLDVGVDLLVATLSELEAVLDAASGASKDLPFSPVQPDAATEIADWSVPYLLSGVIIDGRAVYRFTPRCLQDGKPETRYCTTPPPKLKNGTIARFKIGSGFDIVPVANGTLLIAANETVAPAGFWIVV